MFSQFKGTTVYTTKQIRLGHHYILSPQYAMAFVLKRSGQGALSSRFSPEQRSKPKERAVGRI
jgi:hypothetical protein